MKYHPDRVRCDGPDGEEAKKKNTAKFAEISAAYELLSSGEISGEGSGASHPSFANAAAARSARTYPERYNYQEDLPFPHIDPFGFGSFGHFSDPFELFRRTFGDVRAFDDEEMGFSPFLNGPSSAAMYAPTFGGFTQFSTMMNAGFPSNSTSSSYSRSTYHVGGNGLGASSRMVSTTTRVINGKAVTRREETVVNPDGTTTTTVSSTGDTDGANGLQAIQEDNHVAGHIEHAADIPHPAQLESNRAPHTRERSHCTRRAPKIETKQEQTPSTLDPPGTHHPRMPSGETYIIDLTGGDNVCDLTNADDSKPRAVCSSPGKNTEKEGEKGREMNKACNASAVDPGNIVRMPSRKRKFCEVMSRCFLCCFPIPRKRRRVDILSRDDIRCK